MSRADRQAYLVEAMVRAAREIATARSREVLIGGPWDMVVASFPSAEGKDYPKVIQDD